METTSDAAEGARYVVIGLGGVGGVVLRWLVPYLHTLQEPATVLVVDGDDFEDRNRARMWFEEIGPKATVLACELAQVYGDRVTLIPVPDYVTPENVAELIGEGDIVFCLPDNHFTRRVVELRCGELRDVALFCGGNDGIENGKTGTFGNVQVYLRSNGRDLTNPISRFHPEIETPADRGPGAAGCAAQLTSAPQLAFTNLAVASALLGSFYAWRCGKLGWEEAYLDLLLGRQVPVRREVTPPSSDAPSP
jgi:hypothetical protein